jgi:beta-phosphoglucomutase
MLSAVVFDFDGIIVDTEPLHYRAFQRILEPLGLDYSWEEYVELYMGFDDRDAFIEAYRRGGRPLDDATLEALIEAKGQVFQEVIAQGVTPYPGVVDLICSLEGRLPLAVCSGALPGDILPVLQQFNILDAFSVIVTAADVAASKPDPASYRLAVQRLQAAFPSRAIDPQHCIAIEDTPAGIASAQGAGIRVLAVTNSYPADKLSAASSIVPSLSDVTLDTLSDLVR